MINFSLISKKTFFGNLFRFFLKIIPDSFVIRIIQGRLRGKKWVKGSGVNSYWLGSYEPDQVKLFENFIKDGDVVFDIGANAGFYSILSAELAGKNGKIFSFEPLPQNYENLRRHIEINGYENIKAFDVAVSDKEGFSFFSEGDYAATGYLSDGGKIKVKTMSIGNWIEDKKLPIPNILKIDVEGAESLVLKGAFPVIKEFHPLIFLSLHSEEAKNDCFAILQDCGYNVKLKGNSFEGDKVFIF